LEKLAKENAAQDRIYFEQKQMIQGGVFLLILAFYLRSLWNSRQAQIRKKAQLKKLIQNNLVRPKDNQQKNPVEDFIKDAIRISG
jgi:uncharacterized lipoprotein YddW (UPF0748 family)